MIARLEQGDWLVDWPACLPQLKSAEDADAAPHLSSESALSLWGGLWVAKGIAVALSLQGNYALQLVNSLSNLANIECPGIYRKIFEISYARLVLNSSGKKH